MIPFRQTTATQRLLSFVCTLTGTIGVLMAQEVPPTTNSIPTNLFLTDDSRLFWYKRGERLVTMKSIEEAQKSQESRPADQDPEGHWGKVVDGYQLSLRFDKADYTNGEPIVATVLLRNVSDQPRTYVRQTVLGQRSPVFLLVWKNEEELKLKTVDNTVIISSASNVTLQPRTQHRYRLQLDKFYDLSGTGSYSVQAEYGSRGSFGTFPVRGPGQQAIASQKVAISITNAPTR
jgi:hypothetical protein